MPTSRFEEHVEPTPKQIIKTVNDRGRVLEAAQRVVLPVLGMGALVYEVVRAVLG